MTEPAEVAVVGGGIIGCAIAYELGRRGRSVTLLERDRIGGQALIAWSGLLALPAEEGTSAPLRDLAAASLAIYPEVVDDLISRTGMDPEFRRSGALHLAVTEREEAALRSELSDLQRWDSGCRWVENTELRDLEPELARHFRGAMFAPGESHILSPRLVRSYARAAALNGVQIRETNEVRDLVIENDRITGIITTTDVIHAETVVLAVGSWSAAFGQRIGLNLPVGPLRGQLLRLSTWQVPIRHVLYRGDSYIVGKSDGMVTVGSTEDEASFDRRVTNAGLAQLTCLASQTVPLLGNATFVDAWAGLRPLPADGVPLIGWAPGLRNLLVATGHARNGVLWSPITARIVADLLDGAASPVAVNAFDPGRFHGNGQSTQPQ